ncbi:MAG: IS630 family transposase, partial [Acaryochloris sp. RU_4_1]|nr:IS630 family transposase [Acaryochloris sp. RU_4_1]
LLQLDHAKAHCAEAIDWPENVLPLFQPSHSPELNPVERLWQEMRKPFKGKIFEDLPQLQQSVFDELKALKTQKVPSLIGYSFILDALPI